MCRQLRRIACCQMTSISGMSEIKMAAWCPSLLSRPHAGRQARRVWNAITVILRLRLLGSRTGVSTGTAMDIMESLVKQLPNGFGLEWTAMSYQERLSGAQAPALYAISLLVVFLCLAALYESWSVPFSVMLVVPLGVIGALLATWMRGLENDVYFQVGLLTVIGLSAKNAILIVEFANEMNQKGHDLFEATLHACRQRLRPILMTSLAFIFGVLPMATSTGAGSGGQHAVGTGVMGGMISATILAIYFVPLFFVLVRRRFPLKPRPE